MTELVIGITFNNNKPVEHILGSSGLHQNIAFLYDLLESLGHRVTMLVGDTESSSISMGAKEYKLLTLTEALEQQVRFDIVFEAGLTIDQHHRSLIRMHCGARIVCIRYGNSLFMDMEGLFVKRDMVKSWHVGKPEMLWISPHFERANHYFEAIYNCPVEIAPFIWEPRFTPTPFAIESFGQVPDIIVMEPNISVLKNALIPMVIINELCRNHPEQFNKAIILNAEGFHSAPYFLNNFVDNLECLQGDNDKVFFLPRYSIRDAFKKPDILLGFQHYNELNYLYLEALYMGIPLVHNSPYLIDVGYFYPEFDTCTGANQLTRAIEDYSPEDALPRNQAFLKQFSIHDPIVQTRYQSLLEQVMATP